MVVATTRHRPTPPRPPTLPSPRYEYDVMTTSTTLAGRVAASEEREG